MEKEFTPYEEALALKELGFDEPCFGVYLLDNPQVRNVGDTSRMIPKSPHFNAPLYQQAFRWFEKKYGLYLDRHTICNVNEIMDIRYTIRSIGGNIEVEFPELYSEFDSVKSKIICLRKLIEIVKK